MNAETSREIEMLKAELAQLAGHIKALQLSRTQRTIRVVKKNKYLALGLAGLLLAIPVSLFALNITKMHTFTAGNPTVASEVNANFDQLFTKINDLAAYHPPIGSIIAWHKDMLGGAPQPLPAEWVECNGQVLNDPLSPYNTRTIPNLNGSPGGANSPGQATQVQMFLRGGTTSGTGQQDSFQGHWHQAYEQSGSAGASQAIFGASYANGIADGVPLSAMIKSPIADATNGTPRTASETRPVNMSVVWIMKVK